MEHVDHLVERLSIHDANLSREIDLANQYGDLDTVDLLNEISRTVSQDLWFLEAHFQTEATSSITISGGAGSGVSQTPQGQQTTTTRQTTSGQQRPAGQQIPATQGQAGTAGGQQHGSGIGGGRPSRTGDIQQ